MNYNEIEQLLKTEKKTDASKEKKQAYIDAMVSLLKDEGYTENCELFLTKGFSFVGYEPVIQFIKNKPDAEKEKLISQILQGKEYRLNVKGIGFKIAVNLLGHSFNLFNENKLILSSLIREITMKSKNKEGKSFGDSNKVVEKYFIDVLSVHSPLPNLTHLELSNKIIVNFSSILMPSLSMSKTKNGLISKKSYALENWLNDFVENQGSSISEKKTEQKNCNFEKSITNKPLKGSELIESAKDLQLLGTRLKSTIDYIVSLEKGMNTLQANNNNLHIQLEKAKTEKEALEVRIKVLEDGALAYEERLANIMSELNKTKTTLAQKDNLIKKQEAEIGKLNSVLSVYSTDKENSQNEQLNAIASKLKAEFEDFMSVENDDMSLDLGENFRHQIKAIFKILTKSGIEIGGR